MEDEAKLMRDKLTERFDRMMKVLFRQEGANLEIGILASEEAQDFIEAHSSVLNGSFRKVEMSEAMRKRLERSNYVFSGLKTFHELNEAFPSLLDENGNRKTFERFLNDVRKIDETYNSNYLRAEFTFVQASAEMAAKWERFMQDGDRYYLQYRTAGDAKVRPTHAEMAGITLPASDPFWAEFYPPNGWGCRCSVVQVRKSKYPPTDHEEAMARGKSALEVDKKGMFRFNAGMEQKTMPDYNPYTSSMAGAALCFFIARVMGREVVEKLTGKTVLNSMDGFFTRYGKHTILVCRLLPFVPFDPVSYAAGLTSIRFRSFFIATGLGQLPATIVYSWAGSILTGGTFWFVTGLFILFALTVVIFMAKKIWLERQKRNA